MEKALHQFVSPIAYNSSSSNLSRGRYDDWSHHPGLDCLGQVLDYALLSPWSSLGLLGLLQMDEPVGYCIFELTTEQGRLKFDTWLL